MSRWQERDHPRDGRGRFARKAGGDWVEAVSDGLIRGHVPVRGRDIRSEFKSEKAPRIGFRQPDPLLGRLLAAQGYDGLPEVISREEMDRRVDAGWPEMWRGVGGSQYGTAAENAEQYRSGKLYPGSGIFGNGTYAAVAPQTALAYVDGDIGRDFHTTPGIIRIALRPDARVVDFDELVEQYPHLNQGTRQGKRGALDDPGRLATALGYDAIAAQARNVDYRDGRVMYYVILNRTAVAVQEAQT